MKRYLGYLRVSTKRQGDQGVSLQEQKRLIEVCATRLEGEIVEWFEERETAAKRGRREFARMIQTLGRKRADGVILHKIDRGARNLHDWAQIAELTERGIEVHFAHEALDMNTRGGRLAADIQAVVAADYVRNLRDEAKKGLMGRLRQGIYPFRAPIGYLNRGKGKTKEIDPVTGPLVRQAFELYATGEWNFPDLADEMYRRGLRNVNGARLSLNGMTTVLNNPFYFGLMHVKAQGETFEGKHEPLIAKALFDRVQLVLRGKRPTPGVLKHNFAFRRMISCERCKRSLIGERIKQRYVYYRCHTDGCQGTLLSETALVERYGKLFGYLSFDEQELRDIGDIADDHQRSGVQERKQRQRTIELRIAKCDQQLARLADLVLDGTMDTGAYRAKHRQLVEQKHVHTDELAAVASEPSVAEKVRQYVELAIAAKRLLNLGNPDDIRATVQDTTSNLSAVKKEPAIRLKSPYQEIVLSRIADECEDGRGTARTSAREIFEIMKRAVEAKLGLTNPSSPDVRNQAA